MTTRDRIAFWLALAAVCAASNVLSYAIGREAEMDLSIRSMEQAEYATELLSTCIDQTNLAMGYLLRSDPYAHQQVTEAA